MSRELLGLVLLGVLCIMLSPFYKEIHAIEKPSPTVIDELPQLKDSSTIKSKNLKTIVFLSDSFLPKTFAGTELSGYETIKYLRNKGHVIKIFVKEYVVNEYHNFPIYKYDPGDRFCVTQIKEADIVLFQMGDEPSNFELIQTRTKPVYIFVHLVDRYQWILQQKVTFPMRVVYNSHMTQDTLPTFHDNMRMIPYVDIDKFKSLRTHTVQNDVVCLINCNNNKGGHLLKALSQNMSNVQFLGVKGSYANQIVESNPPPNLTYIKTQSDVRPIFKKIGILIMPSRNETWGRTAVEAMASGVVVIHSEAAGLVECVGGAGILCTRDDEDAWAEAIRRIIGDRAYRERLRQYGFKRVQEIKLEQERGRREFAMMIEE